MEGLSACECPICFLILNHTTHEPMSMPCGHTLCKVCVLQLGGRSTHTATRSGAVSRPTFQCPICRQWVNADSVSLNVTLRDLLAELDKKSGVPLGTALNVVYSEVVVEDVLDRGAFGEVCRGRWRGNEVAVKLFSTGRPTPETMEAFQREVFVMNTLRHPNVVLLLGACQTPPKLAIIMEYVSGGSLHQLIHVDKRSLLVVEVAHLVTDVCRGLQYLHSINILHRDLKSKNVLLTGPIPCQAKLCDFGLSRMRQESATMTGNIGTVHWTAPEVLNNQRYKFSADVYGLGMVVYEMVSGCVPLGHMVPMAVMLAVAVRRERPDIPDNAHPTFQQLIKDCTEWVPEDRPSLPTILTCLATITPPPPARGEGGGEGRRLHHQDSLGVVFLSATDSADLTSQESTLAQLAQQAQAPPTPHPPPSEEVTSVNMVTAMTTSEKTSVNMATALNHPPAQLYQPPAPVDQVSERTSYNLARAHQAAPRKRYLGEGSVPWPRYTEAKEKERETDKAVAMELQSQMREAQLQADRELAEQLQMRENSFQAAHNESQHHSVFPPQPLLDTIKKKKFPQLKHVEATPTETTPPETPPPGEVVPLRRKLGSMFSKAFKSRSSEGGAKGGAKGGAESPPSSRRSTKKTAQPQSPQVRGQKSEVAVPVPRSKMSSSSLVRGTQHSAAVYQNISGFEHYEDHVARPVNRVTVGSLAASHPPPPPPPPPPLYRRDQIASRQGLLREVRNRAPTVARQLRPVQTIEKRAFRVGHVVGGYDSQQGLFTTQNLIQSFNRHRLRPVMVPEPPPAYPVGRVVQSRERVKRMSSQLQSSISPASEGLPSLPPLPPSPPRRRLHPAIQSAVEVFSRDNLHHVETVVKQRLPNKEELEQEKRSKFIEELLAFDRSLLVTVNTVFKDRLPSADVLEIERRQAVDSDLTHTKDLVLHSVLTFDPSGLHHVVTEVKNHLPSIGTIELEKNSKTMRDDQIEP